MSRAIVKNGRIIKLTINPKLGIEVGTIPKGVGLERLFWDGTELVDLYSLKKFYVHQYTFKLSPIEQPGTTLVNMNYKDRHDLTTDVNGVRLKTKEEIDQPKNDEYKSRRKTEFPDVGDQLDAILKYLETKDDLTTELNDIITSINDTKIKWKKTTT